MNAAPVHVVYIVMAITVTYITWEIIHNKLTIIPCRYLLSGMSCVLNIFKTF